MLDQMDKEIAAVVIATPAVTHADLTRRALERNKNVLVEKPLATTVAEAQRIVDAASATGLEG